MTSPDYDSAAIARLIRAAVREGVKEATQRPRVTTVISGNVEDVSEDLDTLYVRMDQEGMLTDPTESDNYGFPGVFGATRIGETYINEQVRVNFDGSAGATAMRTSTEHQIVLPYGAETGRRIVFDGNTGSVTFYNEADEIVGYLDDLQWFVGADDVGRVRLDPVGGIRLWDENSEVRVLISPHEGVQVREADSGITGVVVRHDGIVVADPATGETISLTTGGRSSLPAPRWAGTEQVSPTASHSTPAISSFGDGNHLDLRFVSAAAAGNLGAQSYTPPAGWTESSDVSTTSGISLQTSTARRSPAQPSPGVANFTSTTGSYTRRVGHSVIVRGGHHHVTPAVTATEVGSIKTFSTATIPLVVDAPPSVSDGDLLFAHICLAGGAIPVGWTVPAGWVQLGVHAAGVGTSFVLGSGIWYRQWHTGDPLQETLLINMSTAVATRVHATLTRVSSPFLFPGGVQIRVGDRPIRRILDSVELSAASMTLCDFQNIPQGYDNLELLIDTTASGAGSTDNVRLRFNGDSGANYHSRRVINVSTFSNFGAGTIPFTQLSGTAGSQMTASAHIYGYATSAKPTVLASAWIADNVSVSIQQTGGQWDGASGTSIINRIVVDAAPTGAPTFAAGSKATLYGY